MPAEEKPVEEIVPSAPHKRPSWDEYFINIMRAVATRSTCNRGMVGAVITLDNRIVATGYAGAPKGMPHCDEAGHLIRKSTMPDGRTVENCIRTTHAEMNALLQAARFGTPVYGGTVYCKMEPCLPCAHAVMGAGIKRIVAEYKYHDASHSREFLSKAGIDLIVLKDTTPDY